jgi:flagellar biosynthesis/type III secretory pathway chaperone
MTNEEHLSILEDTLVCEFRLLQSLVDVTQRESSALLKGSHSVLMPILEDKETILDQIGVQEAAREKVVQQLGALMGVDSSHVTVKALLPYLEKEQAERLRRLCDGIVVLSEQQRGLNLNVTTLAQSWIDMIHSTQAYLLSFFQTPANYQPPGATYNTQAAPVWATERRA